MPKMSHNEETASVDSALDSLLEQKDAAHEPKGRRAGSFLWRICIGGGVLVVAVFSVLVFALTPPSAFPSGFVVTIPKGMTISETAVLLEEKEIIRSSFLFKILSLLLGGNSGLKAGEYHFSDPISVYEVAKRFSGGIQNVSEIRVTIPEGLSNAEVASLLVKSLPRLDRVRFVELAKKKEGYLFPDTYVFQQNATEEDIISELTQNFEKRILPLRTALERSGKTPRDILIMASLIEGEARTSETRREISGILWRRMELGMLLQVDAVFPYILGKNTFEVTTEDMKVDSPYNTYKYAGLPPGPINNPSFDAISASVHPNKTVYLYYLTDSEGVMHYARTHAEHLTNRAKYLGK